VAVVGGLSLAFRTDLVFAAVLLSVALFASVRMS
jgi:hypothetical protein